MPLELLEALERLAHIAGYTPPREILAASPQHKSRAQLRLVLTTTETGNGK